MEAFELREAIETIKNEGDIADAIELEKVISAKLDLEGSAFERMISKTESISSCTLRNSAARIVYLHKALETIKTIDENFEHMP